MDIHKQKFIQAVVLVGFGRKSSHWASPQMAMLTFPEKIASSILTIQSPILLVFNCETKITDAEKPFHHSNDLKSLSWISD
jgi:hypothetical protein